MSTPCLRVRGLKKAFRAHGGGKVVALAGVDLEVAAGECVAVVGPSGSGKSTLARVLVRLESADAGAVELGGVDWLGLGGEALRRYERKRMAANAERLRMTDGLNRLFSNDLLPLEPARRAVLGALASSSWLRRRAIRHGMQVAS